MPNATGVVDINSRLKRQAWLKEGLIQARAKSIWTPYTGTSANSIIYQKNDLNAKNGQVVNFDYDGFLTGEGFRGKEQAFGKGEAKKKFSDQLTVEFGRYAVDNGSRIDSRTIDALDLNNHSDSRAKLSDLWIRAKDQAIIDSAQGFLRSEAPSHFMRPNGRATTGALTSGDVIDYDTLIDFETILKTGRGLSGSTQRTPLQPLNGGFYMFLDAFALAELKKSTKFQNLMASAAQRGANNPIMSGVIASYGMLNIVELPSFYGSSSSTQLFKTAVEQAGLRTLDDSGNFQGTSSYDGTGVISRGFVLGKSAIQLAFGEMPDYRYQESEDFGIKSESAMEVTYNVRKTTLTAEDEDYDDGKVAGNTFGVIGVEMFYA